MSDVDLLRQRVQNLEKQRDEDRDEYRESLKSLKSFMSTEFSALKIAIEEYRKSHSEQFGKLVTKANKNEWSISQVDKRLSFVEKSLWGIIVTVGTILIGALINLIVV